MVKKVLMVMALFAVLLVPAFAATQVSIDWQWQINDPAVKYFRYQVDGDSPDGWTVVGSDVTSYLLEGADGSRSYTFFLQQSYDGIYWSESSISVSKPVVSQSATLEGSFVTEEEFPPYYVDSITLPVEGAPGFEESPEVEETEPSFCL